MNEFDSVIEGRVIGEDEQGEILARKCYEFIQSTIYGARIWLKEADSSKVYFTGQVMRNSGLINSRGHVIDSHVFRDHLLKYTQEGKLKCTHFDKVTDFDVRIQHLFMLWPSTGFIMYADARQREGKESITHVSHYKNYLVAKENGVREITEAELFRWGLP